MVLGILFIISVICFVGLGIWLDKKTPTVNKEILLELKKLNKTFMKVTIMKVTSYEISKKFE